MKCIFFISIISLFCISQYLANDLILGSIHNTHLIWQQKANYMGIPFKKRVKEIFYSDPSQQIIKGIVAKDLDHTGATAILTAGGVGFTYANIRLKSERGSGLNYEFDYYA